ncbi:MAG: sodium-dependent transporter [Ruminococcus sp.]|nr:sodium-dependent transporter [Ruminococcus sp.]MCI5599661.1 sodium-dependent transporter [Ruminococcus sp.]MDD5889350.1 sodium-dependent transporter [Ruminococcus sp.]MDD6531099.1 sodium-dependent transporter [Ruminococcus sp.]MDD6709033.1 sodium-dependent transporter [Ruminococcus sp.]
MERESFKSRTGFLLVSAGCAIGIGNVWRFPYVVGQNGGGLFVLFYLIFLVLMGIPVLTMELAVGRASGKSAVLSYKTLEKPKSKWHIHGWFCMLGCYMLMMYYTTVSGWMTSYFYKFATGEFKTGMDSKSVSNVFNNLTSSPIEMLIWIFIITALGFFVCSKGVQKGLEKVSKFMMVALLVLIVVLAIHSVTLSGAKEGLSFYLIPDLERVSKIGLGNVITSAMSQAFFTLSLGIAAMEIFGSYMKKDHTLTGEAVRICCLDTFVAIMAGLIIFPACFSYNVEAGQGPALIFDALPNVFVNMAGGRIWGTLFFLFMTFASFSTVIAVFENLVSFVSDTFHISRKKSSIINFIIVFITSLPCMFGFNLLSGVNVLGMGILDMEDFVVSNILLPLGSLVYLLFCVTKFGWGFDNYYNECNTGKGMKLPRIVKPYLQYVLPILILIVFAQKFIG